MKRTGRRQGKGKPPSSSTSVGRSCGKTGHFARNCPNYRASAVEGEELYPSDDAGDWSHLGEDDWSDWTEWAINAVTVGIRIGMINFGLGTLGPGILRGILGVGLRTFGLRLQRPLLRRRPKLWRGLGKRPLLLRQVVRQLCPCQL